MELQTKKKDNSLINDRIDTPITLNETEEHEIKDLCDENFSNLQKIHSILINCSNLSTEQKREFCINERYYMKQCLQKLLKERKE